MDVSTFEELVALVSRSIERKNTSMRGRQFLQPRGLCETESSLSYQFRIAQNTIYGIIPAVCAAIYHHLGSEIQVPESENEWKMVAEEFWAKWNFPLCLGARSSCFSQYREKEYINERKAIPAAEKIVLTLRYLATGETESSLSYQFRIAQNTIYGIIPAVCAAIYHHSGSEIQVPESENEWKMVAEEFWAKWNFPLCLGTNGRVSDGGVWGKSKLKQAITNGDMNIPEAELRYQDRHLNCHLSLWLMMPFR
ncbi:protein ALP1-like [Trichonephila inaurata madagascariensis]|uniref:Protein ALP1-like n=1 Tax=Trichonephila inaurata madagascariensis TaxID=2747483 RepID=A0A8X7C6Z3_9ARAC|nr:protein ALP1-like [Trichonephila inaurata madagascariensis]